MQAHFRPLNFGTITRIRALDGNNQPVSKPSEIAQKYVKLLEESPHFLILPFACYDNYTQTAFVDTTHAAKFLATLGITVPPELIQAKLDDVEQEGTPLYLMADEFGEQLTTRIFGDGNTTSQEELIRKNREYARNLLEYAFSDDHNPEDGPVLDVTV